MYLKILAKIEYERLIYYPIIPNHFPKTVIFNSLIMRYCWMYFYSKNDNYGIVIGYFGIISLLQLNDFCEVEFQRTCAYC